jgi:hypothetical protein
VRHEHNIDLTPAENSRVKAYALKHGLTIEEAVSRLAREQITEHFVVRKHRGNVVPLRGPIERSSP